MSPVHDYELSPRERQIMDAVYRLGVATVAEATAAIDDPPTETAVRTMLGNLVRRGMLRKEFDGRAAVYRPVQARQKAGKTALRRVLDTFFGGSLLSAVSVHLSQQRAGMPRKELEELRGLIDKELRERGP
ncbi:MAG: BlaI/MecI/CopY family transcriptional regulator [Phycisphaerales bacterium]